jgi:enoyl-[acyl-carrier-protein] reductase (NADH)
MLRLVTQIVAPSCARSKGAMGKTFEIADMPALTLEMHHKLRLLERDLRLALDDCDGIFPGPIKTLTACSVGHPSEMLMFHTDRAPPHRSVDQLEVGGAALILASYTSSVVTGEVIYVESGHNLTGI